MHLILNHTKYLLHITYHKTILFVLETVVL